MAGLPKIPGLEVLAEMGRDSWTSRYRLQGSDSPSLVIFHDPMVASAVQEGAKRLDSVNLDGLVRIEQVVVHEGRLGVILRGDLGSDLWRAPVQGELKSLPLLHQLADVLAGLFRQGLSHGALIPEGVCRLSDGSVIVLPPVILPAFLRAAAGTPDQSSGATELSPAGRDLSALGNLACHLIAGLKPSAAAGVGSLPEALKNAASPATAQAVRLVLEAAAREPKPDEAAELLERIGWARPEEAGARRRRARARVPKPQLRLAQNAVVAGGERPARRPGSASGDRVATEPTGSTESERRRPERRLPVLAGVLALALLGAGLLFIGVGDAVSEFWSGRPHPSEALPSPTAPLDRRVALDQLLDEVGSEGSSGEAGVDAFSMSASALGTDSSSTALADRILEELAKKQAQKKPVARKERSYERTLIREGDRLKEEAKTVLGELREARLTPKEKNSQLEEAIALLEQSRDKYAAFAEQFPSKERLVESSISDVNALIFHAHRQKSVK